MHAQFNLDNFNFLHSTFSASTNMAFYNFDNADYIRFSGYNYYGVSSLNRVGISGAYSHNARDFFSINSNTMQFNGYGDYNLALGYHRNYTPRLTGGLQYVYRGIRSSESIQHDHFNLNLMANFQLTPQLKLGLLLAQILPKFVESGSYIAANMRMEAHYFIQDYLIIWVRISKQLDRPLSPEIGLFYNRDKLYVNMSLHPTNAALSYVIGYQVTHHLQLQLGNQYHQQLGWSSQLSIIYNRKK